MARTASDGPGGPARTSAPGSSAAGSTAPGSSAPGSTAPGSTAPGPLTRFDGVERAVHWCNALLFAVLVFTGACLYFTPLVALVGRRELIERIHVYTGLALPLPVILALCGSWGDALRGDIRRLNRWNDADRGWMRSLLQARPRRDEARAGLRQGKFNAGQKLNAAFVAGAGLVMLVTGCLLRWYRPFPLSWRAGASFVHGWLALVIVVVIVGHIRFALADREALRSIVRGRISRSWARRHAPAWLDEVEGEPDTGGSGGPEALG